MHIYINDQLFQELEGFSRNHGRDVDLVIEEAVIFFLRCQEGEANPFAPEYDIYQHQWLLDELAQR